MSRLLPHVLAFTVASGGILYAQGGELAGLVVDQTGLVLPGATVTLYEGDAVVAVVATGSNGRFVFAGDLGGDAVVVALDGFDPIRVPRQSAGRVVLSVARASTAVEVSGSESTTEAEGIGSGALGRQFTRETMQSLPSARHNVRESLPLLPSVVRGPDGLLRIGGTRPHEAPLLLDGFDVTDPASGVSAIDPPLESVEATQVLRDPTAVTLGGFLGSAVTLNSRGGKDKSEIGIEGFLPRPRLSSGGFGTIEGFSPRAYWGGSAWGGAVKYFVSGEYDFDRIPVPGVTLRASDPNLVAEGGTAFGRIDVRLGTRDNLTLEGLFSPIDTTNLGLSPLRTPGASPGLRSTDTFAGIIDRHVLGEADALTVRFGTVKHSTNLTPKGSGPALALPDGWQGNSSAFVDLGATRYNASVAWEHSAAKPRSHDVTAFIEGAASSLGGSVAEGPVLVEDGGGRIVRRVDFGPPASVAAHDRTLGAGLRDVWHLTDRLQVEAGARADLSALGGFGPSARAGLRYQLDPAGTTVIRVGFGRFVGRIPLNVPSFAGYPTRFDRSYDPGTGEAVSFVTLQPAVERLRLPHAWALNAQVEREIIPGFDALLSATDRRSSSLPNLHVPGTAGALSDGALLVSSVGTARYWEFQASGRIKWGRGSQAFVSYVRSSSRGDLNDFGTLVRSGDSSLLQPGGTARLEADAPNRWLCWGTLSLPADIVLSPALEWHSGFPYSVLDAARFYQGPLGGGSFPAFLSIDGVISKRVSIKSHRVKLEGQIFGLTRHFNPRDVYAVIGSPRFGTFTNSVGLVTRGDVAIDW